MLNCCDKCATYSGTLGMPPIDCHDGKCECHQESESWTLEFDSIPTYIPNGESYQIRLKSFIRTLIAKEREEAELKAGGHLMSAFRAGQLELLGKIKLEKPGRRGYRTAVESGYAKAVDDLDVITEALKIKIEESL